MLMLCGSLVLSLLLASSEALVKRGSDDPETLRQKVIGSKVFHDKVIASCKDYAPDMKNFCEKVASDRLFCELLSRSKMENASRAAHCTGSFASMKSEVMHTSAFQKQAEDLAVQLGCTGVKKSENCDNFVQEAAFCLAFADKLSRFTGLAGEKDEAEYCKHIDEKMPELSFLSMGGRGLKGRFLPTLLQVSSHSQRAPEDELAKEMTHDLEMNFNKIAPFGKEDTAKELQDHAAKTQDTLVDAVENAEVAEIKRAVFRALTRLRAATIKEFDTIARLETQAIDAYNDAHHYRAENPLTHLHEDEAPVETDKLKSFH